MLGEQLSAAEITSRGIEGDRRLALIHTTTGKVVSAKHPRLWEKMLQLHASSDGKITGPDGKVYGTDEELSAFLGQPVVLTDTPPDDPTIDRESPDDGQLRESHLPPGAFFDFAALHLITTSTLDSVPADYRRFRPNLVLDTAGAGFIENAWVGRHLHIGADVIVKVIVVTPRCAVPTLAHGDLPRDRMTVRRLNEKNRVVPLEQLGPQPCAGVYAQVLAPGTVRLGDEVRL